MMSPKGISHRAITFGLFVLGLILPAQSQVLIKTGDVGFVYTIVPVGDEIWLGTDKGVLRLDRKSNQAVPVRDVGFVYKIVPVGDEIWLGTSEGALRLDRRSNHPASPLEGHTGLVNRIFTVGEEIWFGGDEGAFRLDRKSNQAVPVGDTRWVSAILPGDDEIWLGAYKGTFRLDRKSNQAVPVGDTGTVYTIVKIDDEIWLGAYKGTFHLGRESNQLVPVSVFPTPSVHTIVPIGDEIWLGAYGGLFCLDRKSKQLVSVVDTGEVLTIVPDGDEVWLGTVRGAFRLDRKSKQPVPVGGLTGSVHTIVLVDDEIWLGAYNGVVEVLPNTKMQVDLDGELPLIARFLGTRVWFEGNTRPIVRYVDVKTGRESYDSSRVSPIMLVLDRNSSSKLLDATKDPNNWMKVTGDGPSIPLKPGPTKIYFSVRDKWGNKTETQLVEGWVIPTWTLAFLLPILCATFCVICLMLSPYVRYCHMVLMNPFLRNWVSFGAVPTLLTAVPPLRRYIFRRYRRGLSRAAKFQSLGERYVIPDKRFTTSKFAEALVQSRVVAVHGQSGIGKSAFLIYLAYQSASRKAAHQLLRHLIPVFIDLSIAGDVKPEVMVRFQLRKYGDLTDEKLTDVLLDHGEFLLLFDGLNEVSESSAKAIVQFADMHREHSNVCLTTQVPTQELLRVSTLIAGSPLADDKVNDLVRNLAKDPFIQKHKFDPESLLQKFTAEIYRICRIPFQLELLVEMWVASAELPKSVDELYSYALGPILDKTAWSELGHGDYPDILSRLAFKMMTEKCAYDPKKDYLPDEMKTELVMKKLLVDRGGVLEFRHDRVRAYLAAKHFTLSWRRILQDEKTLVDANWDAMLEFHLAAERGPNQTRDLLFLLVKKDLDASIHLNSWGLENRTELFKDWQDEFSKEIGRKVLSGSAHKASA